MDIVPIFYDTNSLKSILTWWDARYIKVGGPQSILDLCKEGGLKRCFFVSTNFSTLKDAYAACKKNGITLIPGIEFIMCDDAKVHSAESRQNEHKIIVFMKNGAGYEALLRIYSKCHTDTENKYFIRRFDYNQLTPLWTSDLHLSVPFFDGFISKNVLQHGANIMPDFAFCSKEKSIFREVNTEHPLEVLINKAIDKFQKVNNWNEKPTKTIYYKNREDFKAYTVYRCIEEGTTFDKPELEMFCSNSFCWESFKESIK